MAESVRKRKGTISEDEIVSIFHRYNATTICTLLREVAAWSADVKIDWKKLAQRSCTGISNPREYQLLWHHLAYREPLLENIDGAEPTDEDSDLEFELETVPAVSAEVSSEAAAIVKVIMPSDLRSGCERTNDSASGATSVIKIFSEPILDITTDKEHGSQPFSEMNRPPVSTHKRPLPIGTITERIEGNDTKGVSFAIKKKRKLWSDEEDAELIAAVQKHGEGNWVAILKGDFKHDRTQAQLAQRWSHLKKQSVKSKLGEASNPISTVHSEQLNATRIAVERAISMPIPRNLSTIHTGDTGLTKWVPQKQNHAPWHQPRTSAKASDNPPRGHQSLISSRVLQVGGRIAPPSAAASIRKAAQSALQSKNVIHIASQGSTMTSATVANRYSRPFTMPPLPTKSTLKETKLTGDRAQGISGNSDGSGGQDSPSLPENAEKITGDRNNTTETKDTEKHSEP